MRPIDLGKMQAQERGISVDYPASGPGQFHYSGKAADGAPCLAALDRHVILVSRNVAGLACRIRLSPAQYKGVSLVQRVSDWTVRLQHRDPGLTLDLVGAADRDSAAEQLGQLAALLALPVLDPLPLRAGAVQERRPVGHKMKRPRFLKRRRTGREPGAAKITGREIIARS